MPPSAHGRESRTHRYRGELKIYELRAERAARPLFRSANREVVEQRKAQLEKFVQDNVRARS